LYPKGAKAPATNIEDRRRQRPAGQADLVFRSGQNGSAPLGGRGFSHGCRRGPGVASGSARYNRFVMDQFAVRRVAASNGRTLSLSALAGSEPRAAVSQ